ncbi:MAG: type II toxin-antitoxin system RelE/ParE family toxin [Arenimonas sp.]|nr:type II toxin-antitoxin system RelE/ParE family toxin [Rhizobium sp.]MBW8446815.1 type II toxin-antitoxin system RelE/ParE family toxin [Arenimonas sp.]
MRSINSYTALTWGNEQRRIYIAQLKSRIEWLAKNPRLGKGRPDIRDGLFCFPEGEHVIFYVQIAEGIQVMAVLHNRMLPQHRL